ncbi:family 43 glycosylhydrolase [Cronobacter sakazakii]|uniref:glycoside hydrolase family 43 protein n=1 Tax=Cronobacter sakazakii TaxID=28141 RepID=UPI001AE2A5A1|nr:family 43 glycosylhydrolase [Cronobacter sakazakii]EKK3980995.1 family 43 glycosylhydrolase [Cronobacter sakazakii]EKM6344840.1 family 43 glycosylhydrolase [Cronobacter sakazakii]EKM6352364.1 family 43 glycosylhydrolase [Cronobacter sakazakii]EKM6366933.1 family 43 glycosylhydrolase [Cronobacter sakazakii]EKM6376642.1 family 43 glycosylhydrolase [Cronobacter sakazakii]
MNTSPWPNPLIEQRADPFILRHQGQYYFIASVPEYDRLEIRRAPSIESLRQAQPVVVWRKPDTGPMSELIWAPELHHINGKWYIYFAAAPTRALKDNMFQHRMYVLECADSDPLTGTWKDKGQIQTPYDTFSLDATTFEHQGKLWYLWAQKAPDIPGNSNLYLCEMENPWTLKGEPVMLSKPELEWECRGFLVNEGPAVVKHGERLFITYSASATDENYCMGLLWIDQAADLRAPRNWHKSPQPVFTTSYENRQYGPGHNSFTTTPDGQDVLVYHARNYTEIEGDPLWDPNRHTRVKLVTWDDDGMPQFGTPPADHP